MKDLSQEFIAAWASSRETSTEVAEAIFSIARNETEAQRIWEDPDNAEIVAVAEIVTKNHMLDAADYQWGENTLADGLERFAERPQYDFNQSCHSIEDVASRVNAGPVLGFDWLTSEYLAAAYAIDAAKDGAADGYDYDEGAIRAHLDFLRDAGAEFDEEKAVRLAIK